MQWKKAKRRSGKKANRPQALALSFACLLLGIDSLSAMGAESPQTPIVITVFDFELEDLTPASSLQQGATNSAAALERVTAAARNELSRSGRYRVLDAPSDSTQQAKLRECSGCEAALALKLGAQQSLIGVVRRATQTDYYISIEIRDARTGKLVNQQSANFAGGEEGWASGVRKLLDHQVLYPGQPERLSSSSDEPACRVATVSPVSGFAECIDPPGAPVAPVHRPSAGEAN